MLISGDVSDYNKSILMNSVEMLEELRFIVEDTLDNSSEDAAHRAKYVYGDPTYALCAWRESVARGMIYDGLNKHLEEARIEAVKWTELTKEVSKRKRAKESDISFGLFELFVFFKHFYLQQSLFFKQFAAVHLVDKLGYFALNFLYVGIDFGYSFVCVVLNLELFFKRL